MTVPLVDHSVVDLQASKDRSYDEENCPSLSIENPSGCQGLKVLCYFQSEKI